MIKALGALILLLAVPAVFARPIDAIPTEATDVAFSATDAYASSTIDLCVNAEGIALSTGTGWVGIGEDGELAVRALEGTQNNAVADPCCVCGSHLAPGSIPRCWVNGPGPCCCTAAISPSGWLNCDCDRGACGSDALNFLVTPSE